MRRARFHIATAALVALVATSAHARAEVDLQVGAQVGGVWIGTLPKLRSTPLATPARTVPARDVATRGGVGLGGGGVDFELTVDDHWRVPLAGAGLYLPVGSYDTMVTSIDGSIARLRPWSLAHFEGYLPGLGRRVKTGRFMWGAVVRPGFTIDAIDGSVAAGRDSVPISLSSTRLLVQIEIEGCRRIDPTFRVCLMAAPRVVSSETKIGLVMGLRLEWGR